MIWTAGYSAPSILRTRQRQKLCGGLKRRSAASQVLADVLGHELIGLRRHVSVNEGRQVEEGVGVESQVVVLHRGRDVGGDDDVRIWLLLAGHECSKTHDELVGNIRVRGHTGNRVLGDRRGVVCFEERAASQRRRSPPSPPRSLRLQ